MRSDRDIRRQVHRTIETYGMMVPGDQVLVAVSGGPDSVALLYILWELRHRLGIGLHVAHLDHGLRGHSSRLDARYTRRLSNRLGLPVVVERALIASPPEGGVEEAARRARYDFLHRVAAQVGAGRIATGHTADDQAETVLMRLVRGAGSEGLAGIPPVRGIVVRPLIEVRRSHIEDYLRRRRLRPRQDLTNRQLHLLRNRVRWELIPLLERHYNPNIVSILHRLARLESEESDFFRHLCDVLQKGASQKVSKGKIVLDLSGFGGYFNIVQKYLVRELIRQLKGDLRHIEHHHVERIFHLAQRDSVGSRVSLPGGLMVERWANGLIFIRGSSPPFCGTVKLPGKTRLIDSGWSCRARLVRPDQIPWPPVKANEYEAFLDWSQMHGPFVLRSRRRGDQFQPLGMCGTCKLSDYFIDRKVPRALRDDVPLLAGRDGIIWVVGYGIAESYKVTERTESVLRAQCDRRDT